MKDRERESERESEIERVRERKREKERERERERREKRVSIILSLIQGRHVLQRSTLQHDRQDGSAARRITLPGRQHKTPSKLA